jgi:PhnB protein
MLLMTGASITSIGGSPWGSYFGFFRDKYGIEWMIEHFKK